MDIFDSGVKFFKRPLEIFMSDSAKATSDHEKLREYLHILDENIEKLANCMHELDSYYLKKTVKPLIHFDIYVARAALADMVGEYVSVSSHPDVKLQDIAEYVGRCRFLMQRMTVTVGSLLDQADEAVVDDTEALTEFLSVVNEVEQCFDSLFDYDAPFLPHASRS